MFFKLVIKMCSDFLRFSRVAALERGQEQGARSTATVLPAEVPPPNIARHGLQAGCHPRFRVLLHRLVYPTSETACLLKMTITGVLFICLSVDYRILYAFDEQVAQDAMVFYATFFNAPVVIRVRPTVASSRSDASIDEMQSLLHGIMGLGVLGLVAKLHKWTDLAVYFDGTSLGACVSPGLVLCCLSHSIALFVFGIATYLSVTIPALRTVVQPIPDVDSRADQLQALQLISAGNVINLVLFFLILSLQVSMFSISLTCSGRDHSFRRVKSTLVVLKRKHSPKPHQSQRQ